MPAIIIAVIIWAGVSFLIWFLTSRDGRASCMKGCGIAVLVFLVILVVLMILVYSGVIVAPTTEEIKGG